MFHVTFAGRQAGGRIGRAFLAPALAMAPMFTSGTAAELLRQPSVCSAIGAGTLEIQSPFCRVTPMEAKPGQHDVTLSLSVTTSPVNVGGYRLSETDNYNGGYLPPTVELKPGDRMKVRLLNALAPSTGAPHAAGHGEASRSTNLHTHGLIVSAKNARPALPQNGDNVFVSLDRGQSLDYSIEIPTALPASVFDGKSGIIPHPSGPFWYHSHQHGVSAVQVAGGMSGLLSIGPRDANLVAVKPLETDALRARTDIAYLMLRDIQIVSETDPRAANADSPAVWVKKADSRLCEPDSNGTISPPLAGRRGFCQSPKDQRKTWLFTVNGQRFPTIRIPSGRNNLWRIANLSANVTYDIDLLSALGAPVPFDLVSVDGVVPGNPIAASGMPGDSPEAIKLSSLKLMPAARAEIFIENDNGDVAERRIVLRTKGLNTAGQGQDAGDPWPEVMLAEVILEGTPAVVPSSARRGLNVPAEKPGLATTTAAPSAEALPALPIGCARDIDRSMLEHRRISFAGGPPGTWKIKTELVHPKDRTKPQHYKIGFDADDAATIPRVNFEQYLKDGAVDWDATEGRPRHTCVRLSNGHGQLWELNNPTTELHNFHLHQTKFRVARAQDLRDYGIDPQSVPVKSAMAGKASAASAGEERDVWHDTLPIDAESTIFIVINFDAEEQLGRYVFHCHILKHEDEGLMAPMEVVR